MQNISIAHISARQEPQRLLGYSLAISFTSLVLGIF